MQVAAALAAVTGALPAAEDRPAVDGTRESSVLAETHRLPPAEILSEQSRDEGRFRASTPGQ